MFFLLYQFRGNLTIQKHSQLKSPLFDLLSTYETSTSDHTVRYNLVRRHFFNQRNGERYCTHLIPLYSTSSILYLILKYNSCRVARRRLRKANKTTVDSLATKQREMTYLILGRILIFFLCLKRTVCLASSSSTSSSSHPLRIVSLNKNGGNVKYFDLGSTDTTEENNADYPLGDINDKKTAYLSTVIRSTFLPNGFPVKTPPGYLRYSLWSWIQDISTQLRSVLATQRILEGVGVGSSEATALSALFNYLVRDGCGMAAGKEID